MSRPGRRAAFLDRDGTLIVERDGFLTSPRQLRLLGGAGASIRRLNDAGYVVVLVTNQSGVARGLLDESTLERIHAELLRRLRRHGARIDAIRYCPHHPTEGTGRYRRRCACRKPLPGMIVRAARELDLDLERSVVIGDDLRDVQLAAGTKLRPFLVRTGKGRRSEADARRLLGRRLTVVDRLADAVDLLTTGGRAAGPADA